MDYDEIQYWNKRRYPSNLNMSADMTLRHIQYIKSHVNGLSKVLDFGPGIGRTFSAYEHVGLVEGYDISELYADQAKEAAKGYGFQYLHRTIPIHLDRLPYEDDEFNVAVASEVLLHQTPMNILKIMGELVRIAERVVVISWQEDKTFFSQPGNKTEGMNHCFHYDYEGLCRDNGWKVYDVERKDRQIYFVYEKGNKLREAYGL